MDGDYDDDRYDSDDDYAAGVDDAIDDEMRTGKIVGGVLICHRMDTV